MSESSTSKMTKWRAPRPTGYELRLVNAAVNLVDLLENGMGIILSDSALEYLLELRKSCETYVGSEMRTIPVKAIWSGPVGPMFLTDEHTDEE